ncbi:MAG: aminotransferase class V-fold PLP-dependent enzyme [Anaerotignum sp.]|nr:aminotransferase class V-fold PLP-dependent enzyme [Anaerotignum sp.]
MIRFECDYAEGMHQRILDRLIETNMEQTAGYGVDPHCDRARELIKHAIGREDADVHFLVGGTQSNMTVIASVLRPHQGVFCAESGHLNTHETGAIEATGHKVIILPTTQDGKLTAEAIQNGYDAHWNDATHEHITQPGMVYISQSTEDGTTYTLAELKAISETCRRCELPLFIDGARLGYALAAEGCDYTLNDIANLADVFYIGGTKVGAMMGEAVVIVNPALKKDFRYLIKQRGGMLAKGRLLGIQFETLFEDGLYFEVAKHAVILAMKIRRAFEAKGIEMLFDSKTNQQFPILPNEMMDKLAEKYAFSFWCKVGETHSAVRFCTSWATQEENVNELLADIEKM